MRRGLMLPPFGQLSDPRALAELAVAAEARAWDGIFLWDHLVWPGVTEICDTWVALAAMASATSMIRLGPMVTPLPRRRIEELAKQSVSLDRLSGGRLILGAGSGSDRRREFSGFGAPGDTRLLGDRLDEGLQVLQLLWTGDRVDFHGEHYLVDGMSMLPAARQTPRIPIWMGFKTTAARPLRRAARFDGIYPHELTLDDMRRVIDTIGELRGGLAGFEIAATVTRSVSVDQLEALGATWTMYALWPDASLTQAIQLVENRSY